MECAVFRLPIDVRKRISDITEVIFIRLNLLWTEWYGVVEFQVRSLL